MECGSSALGLGVAEAVCVVFVTLVGSQVGADLHLLREQFEETPSKERVSNLFEPFRLELHPQMVENRVRRR